MWCINYPKCVVGTFEILWVCYRDGNLTFESQTSIYTKCEVFGRRKKVDPLHSQTLNLIMGGSFKYNNGNIDKMRDKQ
jgi:hypothetical protein